jgi:anti-sigma regulatory factor (Ser/Thr protein kinase)
MQPRGSVKATGDLVATAAYQPDRRAASAARRFVRETLGSWQRSGYGPHRDGLIDDAVLLTSELVTNAVLHAGTPVRVTCCLSRDAVQIAVVDYSPAPLVSVRRSDTARGQDAAGEHELAGEHDLAAQATGGRGLALPGQLASSWGITYSAGSKTVWFRIEDSEPGAPGRSEAQAAKAACAPPASEPLPAPTATPGLPALPALTAPPVPVALPAPGGMPAPAGAPVSPPPAPQASPIPADERLIRQ